MANTPSEYTPAERTLFHLRFGWWSLLLFLTLGVALEAMHGFKVGWYLDVGEEVRRLMFRLAHAHGALLGLFHLGYAATLHITTPRGWMTVFASRGLTVASILLPLGFFLGGFGIAGGDPGIGVVFVPAGAIALFGTVVAIGLSLRAPK